ncbi:MAG: hypothetical protein R3F11_30465 [Verrucomicrobiales bacterium]
MAHDPGLAHETLVMGNFGDLLGKALCSEAKDAKAGRGRDAGIAALPPRCGKSMPSLAGQRPRRRGGGSRRAERDSPEVPSTRTALGTPRRRRAWDLARFPLC